MPQISASSASKTIFDEIGSPNVYRILINARTGEVQGERPYSAWKIAAAVVAALILIAIILFIANQNH